MEAQAYTVPPASASERELEISSREAAGDITSVLTK